jgi:hypothetical protein
VHKACKRRNAVWNSGRTPGKGAVCSAICALPAAIEAEVLVAYILEAEADQKLSIRLILRLHCIASVKVSNQDHAKIALYARECIVGVPTHGRCPGDAIVQRKRKLHQRREDTEDAHVPSPHGDVDIFVAYQPKSSLISLLYQAL